MDKLILDAKNGDKYELLDGQQRMTSTFLAMRNKSYVSTVTDQNKPIKRYYYLDINC